MRKSILWIILAIVIFLGIFFLLRISLRFFLAAVPRMMISPQIATACQQAGGYFCEDQKEFCEEEMMSLNETYGRCCPVKCGAFTEYEFSSKKHCRKSLLLGVITYCYCEPNKEKNKVAVIIAKNGIYDTDAINSQILEYYNAVKKDLNIENTGLKRFEGKKISELDKFNWLMHLL